MNMSSDKTDEVDTLAKPLLDDEDENPAPSSNTSPPQKSDSMMRWVVLMLACIAMIGNYYCYDNPAALKTQLEAFVGLSEIQYNMLYTVYSMPNIVLPFFGGYLCDLMGPPRAFALFAATLVCGQAVFSFAVSIKSIPLMYLGRFIYGLGGENMAVGGSVILEDWFRNREMGFAMAVQVSISRLGSVINDVLSPAIADGAGIPMSLWFGVVLCAVSLGCILVIVPIDRAAQAKINEELGADGAAPLGMDVTEKQIVSSGDNEDPSVAATLDEACLPPEISNNPLAGCRDVARFKFPFWLLTACCVIVYGDVLPFNNVASSLLMERDYFKPQPSSSCALADPNQCASDSNEPNDHCETDSVYMPPLPDFVDEEDVDCSDKDYKSGTGEDCAKQFCESETSAESTVAVIMFIPYLISAFASPALGLLVDCLGGRAYICLASGLILAVVHALLGYSTCNPVIPMVGQGVAYSMFAAALWPSVPHLVPKKSVGIAYGVITAVQNLGLALIPLLVSAVYSESGSRYIPMVELLFVICGVAGSICALLLNVVAPQLNKVHPPEMPDPDDAHRLSASINDTGPNQEIYGNLRNDV